MNSLASVCAVFAFVIIFTMTIMIGAAWIDRAEK